MRIYLVIPKFISDNGRMVKPLLPDSHGSETIFMAVTTLADAFTDQQTSARV